MSNELTKDQLILESLHKGAYYYNRFGEVLHFTTSNVNLERITCKYGRKEFYFKYEDFGEKWFLSYDVATKKAQEYIEEITKYISLNTLQKIDELKKKDMIFIRNEKMGIESILLCDWNNWFYDKTKKAFVIMQEINFDVIDFLIADYGKTWALTANELCSTEEVEEDEKICN